MFDIGFWEIAVIAVVALLVVGPNEFPRLVHSVAVWIGKLRRFMSETKSDLDQEFRKMEELKEHMEEEAKVLERHLNADLSEHVSTRSVAAGSSSPSQKQTTEQAADNQAPPRFPEQNAAQSMDPVPETESAPAPNDAPVKSSS